MSRRLPLPEVEARVRAALRAHGEMGREAPEPSSNDEGDGDTPFAGVGIGTNGRGAASAEPVERTPTTDGDGDRSGPGSGGDQGTTVVALASRFEGRAVRRPAAWRRTGIAVAAAVVLVVAAVAVRSWLSEDSGDVSTAAVPMPEAQPLVPCGDELPVQVTVQDAQGPFPGPAPGGPPAEPGQVVRHWQRSDGTVEVRWPARPQPFYDLGRERTGRVFLEESFPMTSTDEPPRAEIDLQTDASTAFLDADVILEGESDAAPPCDVIEVTAPHPVGLATGGLRLTEGPVIPDTDPPILVPYSPVTLAPLIGERRTVDEAPDHAIRCLAPALPGRSGGPDPELRRPTPAEVLLAWVSSDQGSGAISAGYEELVEPDGSVTYAVAANGQAGGWNAVVRVEEDEAGGWGLVRWSLSC